MTLPGMPLHYGDPGVFVCGPEDMEPPRVLRVVGGGRPEHAPTGVWLVLTRCARCARIRAYCSDHRLDWLFRDRDWTHRRRSRLLNDQQSLVASDFHVPDDCT